MNELVVAGTLNFPHFSSFSSARQRDTTAAFSADESRSRDNWGRERERDIAESHFESHFRAILLNKNQRPSKRSRVFTVLFRDEANFTDSQCK